LEFRIFRSFSVVVGCFCLFVVPHNIHVTVAEFGKFVVFIEDLVVLWDLGKYSRRVLKWFSCMNIFTEGELNLMIVLFLFM